MTTISHPVPTRNTLDPASPNSPHSPSHRHSQLDYWNSNAYTFHRSLLKSPLPTILNVPYNSVCCVIPEFSSRLSAAPYFLSLKPDVLEKVKHHLIDVLKIEEVYVTDMCVGGEAHRLMGEAPRGGKVEVPRAVPQLAGEAWHGIYARYGDLVGRETRNWACAHAVLSARAGRRLAFQHARPHYGMEYVIMLTSTGSGNTTAIELARRLAGGSELKIRHNVQSGQALGEVLANFKIGKGGRPENIESVPVLLAESEMASFFKLGTGVNSLLFSEAARLYDASDEHFIVRVSHNPSFTIPQPSLSILGAISANLFSGHIHSGLISGGLLNRFMLFTVEGQVKEAFAPAWDLREIEYLAMSLPDQEFCLGTPYTQVKDLFSPEASEVYVGWWEKVKENEDIANPMHAWFRRQQAHFLRVALMCAFYEKRTQASYQDALCALAVMEFVNNCVSDLAQETAVVEEGTSMASEHLWARTWITDKITRLGPRTRHQLQKDCYNLRTNGKAKWPFVVEQLDVLLKNGVLKQSDNGNYSVV